VQVREEKRPPFRVWGRGIALNMSDVGEGGEVEWGGGVKKKDQM